MALPAETVAAIAQRLADHAGLELPAWVVDARAAARIAVVGCSPADYVALIAGPRGAGELEQLVEAVRVGESRLFRHRSQIEVLAGAVAPTLRARGRRAIRAWSAGCAAGEEPYTLAIVLSRALPGCAISIIATDVSADALARARTARYPRAALAQVPERYRDAFVDDGDAVRVAPELAALVRFERANLLDGPAPRDCHVVWCRNVLIYFTADARRRAIDRLVDATAPGGFVFVGYSESLRDVTELDALRASDTVYYVRRADSDHTPPPRSSGRPPPQQPGHPSLDTDGRTPPPLRTADLSDNRTPLPALYPAEPPASETLALRGQPTAEQVAAEISARLALPGLESLRIDLDGAELLDDELVRVLRRARAAACAAGIAFDVYATRTGATRWLTRHGFGEAENTMPPDRGPAPPRGKRR